MNRHGAPRRPAETEQEARAILEDLFGLITDTVNWHPREADATEVRTIFLAGFTLAAINPEWAARLQRLVNRHDFILVELWAKPIPGLFPVAAALTDSGAIQQQKGGESP